MLDKGITFVSVQVLKNHLDSNHQIGVQLVSELDEVDQLAFPDVTDEYLTKV